TRRAGPLARRRKNRCSSRDSVSGKAECRSGRVFFTKRKFSLERWNVCLVGANSVERIQSPRAGVGRLHLASPLVERSRHGLARTFRETAAHFLRLRDHGKSRSRFGSRSQF